MMKLLKRPLNTFNRISQEYTPLNKPLPRDYSHIGPIYMYHIAAKLCHMRKPKSLVEGDLPPRLVTEYTDILAIPPKHIFDLITATLEWPDTWKDESVTLIPKVPIISSMGELRNLSCTLFFSKVLESFILERLLVEITLSKEQFGGVKVTSATHFTISVLQEVMEAMETTNTVLNLMSFNWMDHLKCLQALRG